MDNARSVYTNASQMDKEFPGPGDSRCTDTKTPGSGRAHGKNSGLPSSMKPVNLLQIGLAPKSGRLLPTLTVIVAGRLLPVTQKVTILIVIT